MKYFIIIFFISPSLSQFVNTGLRPDVIFGDNNDRFDVTNILRHQNKFFKDDVLDEQSEEYRRRGKSQHKYKSIEIEDDHGKKGNYDADNAKSQSWLELLNTKKGRKSLRKKIVNKIEKQVNQLANKIITKMRSMRRFDDNFAYHDDMKSGGGDEDDYKTNLNKFNTVFKDLRKDKNGVSARRLQDIVDDLHGSKPSRRMISDPEREILLHYAFPLDVNIEGFLQTP